MPTTAAITDPDRQRLVEMFKGVHRRDYTSLVEWGYAREQGSGGLSVKALGAVGDGVTDDTIAIRTANLLVKATGGSLYFPAGRYVTQKVTIYARVRYFGDGPGISVIILKAGETTNVLEGENFSTLTGTTSNNGPVQFAIENLTVDGNKANCPSALRGIAIYGPEFFIFRVFVQDCVTDGIFLEWRGDSSSKLDKYVVLSEMFMGFCKIQSCGGNGLWLFGGHDSLVVSVNTGFCGGGAGSGTGGIRAENNGIHFIHCHCYGTQQDYAWNLRGQSFCNGCVGEGARTAQLLVAFTEVNWRGGTLYFPGQSGAKAIAFSSSAATDYCFIEGVYIEKGGAAADFDNAIDFTNCDSGLVLKATVQQATANAYTGVVPADAVVEVVTMGGTASPNLFQRPGDSPAAVNLLDRLYLPPAVRDEFILADGTQPDTTKWTRTLGGSTGTALAVQSLKARFTTGNAGTFAAGDDVTLESILAASLIKDAEILFASVVGTVNAQSFLYAGMRCATRVPVRATDSYFIEISVTASGVIRFFCIKRAASSQTTLYDSTNQAVQVTGNKFWHRFRVKGTSIKYKWWSDGVVEPLAWALDTTDSSVTAAGIISFNAGGGSPAGNNAFQEIDNVSIFAL